MTGRLAHPVQVTARQRDVLSQLVRRSLTPQRLAQRAQILMLAAEGHTSEYIVAQLSVTRPVVLKWRRRWSEAQPQLQAVEAVESDTALRRRIREILADAPRSGRPADISPEQILEIVAIACEDPQASQREISHWTPGEVAREAMRRGIIDRISTRSVDRFLKGGRSSASSRALLAATRRS